MSLFGADEGAPSAAADNAPDQARGSSGRHLDAVSPRAAAAGSEPPKTSALLDQVFESICRPLKVGRLTLNKDKTYPGLS